MPRFVLLVSLVGVLLTAPGCGVPYGDVFAIDGSDLGEDENSNVLRVEVGVVHLVSAVAGRQGGFAKSTRTQVDTLTAVDPTIVSVTQGEPLQYRVVGNVEGETLLRLTANGSERLVPIRVVPVRAAF